VIERIAQHLKPGGWLLLEDLDFTLSDSGEPGPGPACQEWFDLYNDTMRERGIKDITPAYPMALQLSRKFTQVNVRYITFPISVQSKGKIS